MIHIKSFLTYITLISKAIDVLNYIGNFLTKKTLTWPSPIYLKNFRIKGKFFTAGPIFSWLSKCEVHLPSYSRNHNHIPRNHRDQYRACSGLICFEREESLWLIYFCHHCLLYD